MKTLIRFLVFAMIIVGLLTFVPGLVQAVAGLTLAGLAVLTALGVAVAGGAIGLVAAGGTLLFAAVVLGIPFLMLCALFCLIALPFKLLA